MCVLDESWALRRDYQAKSIAIYIPAHDKHNKKLHHLTFFNKQLNNIGNCWGFKIFHTEHCKILGWATLTNFEFLTRYREKLELKLDNIGKVYTPFQKPTT